MILRDYMEALATEHKMVQHTKESVHFSALSDDSQSLMASKMHYPCVILDEGDMEFSGGTALMTETGQPNLLFLYHVSDTGKKSEIFSALDNAKLIMNDFIKRMIRDKMSGNFAILNRLTFEGSEAMRIEMKDAGLYGWALSFTITDNFGYVKCNDNFKS